jgi:DNA polymerase-3 subunit delta
VNLKYLQLPKSGDVPAQGTWLLVQGEEEYLKRTLVERLRGQLLSDEDVFNFDQVDVNDRWDGVADTAEQAKRDRIPTRADRILALAQALPFLGSGRLVLVRNVDLLANEQQKRLAAGLATVPASNHVLLVTGEGKKAKLAADLLKGIEKLGTVYDCSSLTPEDAERWVLTLVDGWGQKIEPAALRLLVTRVGTELRRLQIEVEKLSLLAGDSGRIRVQDVELLTPKLAEESVFHLTDAVAARDAATALAVLRDLTEGQLESPYRIFPLLVRQFRLIWQVKVLLDGGWKPKSNPQDYPRAVALLPDGAPLGQLGGWMGSKLAGPARQMTWEQLATAYTALLECDMASKAIEGVPRQEMEIALELLCAKLCLAPVGRGRA